LPQPVLSPVSDECIYNAFTLQSTALVGGNSTWSFSDGQTLTGFGPHEVYFDQSGCYDLTYTLTDALGCSNVLYLEDYACVLSSPVASFTSNPNELTTFDNTVQFTNNSQGASAYTWIFGDGSPNESVVNPLHEYNVIDEFNTIAFQVTLIATSDEGCIDTSIQYLTMNPELIYYVPNAFTPDGDDFNNIFKPVFSTGYSIGQYNFMIFNRWGELIFETDDIGAGWDGTYRGKPCQEGVYTWKIQFMRSNNAFKEMEVGHVTLLRGAGVD
jgi:gliding motility-associated-like protein